MSQLRNSCRPLKRTQVVPLSRSQRSPAGLMECRRCAAKACFLPPLESKPSFVTAADAGASSSPARSAKLENCVRTRRHFESGAAAARDRLGSSGLLHHCLWIVKRVYGFQIGAGEYRSRAYVAGRSVFPEQLDFTGLRQVSVENEHGNLARQAIFTRFAFRSSVFSSPPTNKASSKLYFSSSRCGAT